MYVYLEVNIIKWLFFFCELKDYGEHWIFVETLAQVGLMYLLVSFLYCITEDVIKS